MSDYIKLLRRNGHLRRGRIYKVEYTQIDGIFLIDVRNGMYVHSPDEAILTYERATPFQVFCYKMKRVITNRLLNYIK